MPVARTLSLKGKLHVPLKIWNKNSANFLPPKSNTTASTANNSTTSSTSKNHHSTSKINKTSPNNKQHGNKHQHHHHQQRLVPKVCTVKQHNENTEDISFLKRDEIQLGPVLGEGGFAQVYGLFQCPSSLSEEESSSCTSNNAQNYAVKVIRKELFKDPKLFRKAADDLVHEAEVLAKLNHHPHIISLRGLPQDCHQQTSNPEAFSQFFLVLDRLEETLADRIQLWKDLRSASTTCPTTASSTGGGGGSGGGVDSTTTMAPALLDEGHLLETKIHYTLQLAKAMEYLHQHRILLRDLKPENIGFPTAWKSNTNSNNNNNTIHSSCNHLQLFDFGFARELPNNSKEEFFQFTNICGTQRYMANEVLVDGHYSLKSDVYSWAMVVWEIYAEKKPFHYLTPSVHKLLVCQNGDRPPLSCYGLPEALQKIIQVSWAHQVQHRLSMEQVSEQLQVHFNKHQNNNNDVNNHVDNHQNAINNNNNAKNSNNNCNNNAKENNINSNIDPKNNHNPASPHPLQKNHDNHNSGSPPRLQKHHNASPLSVFRSIPTPPRPRRPPPATSNNHKGHRRVSSSSSVGSTGAPPPLAPPPLPFMPSLHPTDSGNNNNNNLHESNNNKGHRRSSSASTITTGAPPPLAPSPLPLMPSLSNKDAAAGNNSNKASSSSSVFLKRSMSFDTKVDDHSSNTNSNDNTRISPDKKDSGSWASFFNKRSMSFETNTKEDTSSTATPKKDAGKFPSLFPKRSMSFDMKKEDTGSATPNKDGGKFSSLFHKRSTHVDTKKEGSNSATSLTIQSQSETKEHVRGHLLTGRPVASPTPPLSPTRRAPLSPGGRAPLSPTRRAPLSPGGRAPLSPTTTGGRAPLSPTTTGGRAPLSPTRRTPVSPKRPSEMEQLPPKGSDRRTSSGSPHTVLVSPPVSPHHKNDSGMSYHSDRSGGGSSDVPSSTHSSSHLSNTDKEGILNRARQLLRRDKARKHQRTSSGTPPPINIVSPPQSPGGAAVYNRSSSSWDHGAGGSLAPSLAQSSHSSNDGENNKLHNGHHHVSATGPSLADLQERKKELKEELKQYDIGFAQKHGRMPSKSEKEPIRPLYEHYNNLKGRITTLESLKKQLRAFDKLYAVEHGHTPSQAEKQAIRQLYEDYKTKKRAVVAFLSDFEYTNGHGAALGTTGRRRQQQQPRAAATFTTFHSFDSDLTPDRFEIAEL